jgi:hypothetical protein
MVAFQDVVEDICGPRDNAGTVQYKYRAIYDATRFVSIWRAWLPMMSLQSRTSICM